MSHLLAERNYLKRDRQLEFKGLTFNPFLVILSVVKTNNLTKKREKGK